MSDDQSCTAAAKRVLTPAQKQVVCCDADRIVVEAKAGAGKTTTAVCYARHRPSERFYYLCLNTENAAQARQRFGPNVVCTTAHALAARHTLWMHEGRLCEAWTPMVLSRELALRGGRQASAVKRVLEDFFRSTAGRIEDGHARGASAQLKLSLTERNEALSLAEQAWSMMCTPGARISVPHDAYLKHFALTGHQLDCDRVILDEAQDANAILYQVVASQERCGLLCIGDRHQAIYQYMGAVNAMSRFAAMAGTEVLYLNETHRFGPGVAEKANKLLSAFKGEKNLIVGCGQDGQWRDRGAALIGRTNAGLFAEAAARMGRGVYWVGGLAKYRVEQVLDAYMLARGRLESVRDRTMRQAGDWGRYVQFSEESDDRNALILIRMIGEYGDDIPDLVAQIKANEIKDLDQAELVLSTGHKAKGLEFDCVRVSEDFAGLCELWTEMGKGGDLDEPYINLLYVVWTRAKRALDVGPDGERWLSMLHGREAVESGGSGGRGFSRAPERGDQALRGKALRDHVTARRL